MTPSPRPNRKLNTYLQELGQPTETFESAASVAGWTTLCALALLGSFGYLALLMCLSWPGVAIRLFGTQSTVALWLPDVMAFAIGVVLCIGAVALAVHVRSSWPGCILVCPGGFIHARKRRPEAFRYDDIARVVQDNTWAKPGAAGDGPPMTARSTFLVKLKGRREFYFGGDMVRQHQRLARLLHVEAQVRGIPWEVQT